MQGPLGLSAGRPLASEAGGLWFLYAPDGRAGGEWPLDRPSFLVC